MFVVVVFVVVVVVSSFSMVDIRKRYIINRMDDSLYTRHPQRIHDIFFILRKHDLIFSVYLTITLFWRKWRSRQKKTAPIFTFQ